eukprot:scaffold10568_cov23-Attheya_sp.AAC.2
MQQFCAIGCELHLVPFFLGGERLYLDFKVLALGGFQEVQGSFPVALRSASDGLEVVFRCV